MGWHICIFIQINLPALTYLFFFPNIYPLQLITPHLSIIIFIQLYTPAMINTFVFCLNWHQLLNAPSESYQNVFVSRLKILHYDNINVDKHRFDNNQWLVRKINEKMNKVRSEISYPQHLYSHICNI